MALKFSAVGGSGPVEVKKYGTGTTAQRPASPASGELFYDTTLGGLMVWNGVAWSTFLTPATVQAPTSPSGSDVGTSRAYNNAAVSVSFTGSSELGGVATLYTVTSTPGSITQTGSSSPITVTGLNSNTSYTFTVKASNSYSTATSSATGSVTATTVPDAPVLGTVTDTVTGGTVSVPINSINTGGKAITNYEYSTNGGTTWTTLSPAQTSSPLTISGLTNYISYTLRIRAINANGTGTMSSASNSVTPTAPFTLAQTFNTSGNYTVPNTATRMAIVTFSGGGNGSSGGAGGRGGWASAAIINSPSTGTNYSVTVGAAGLGESSFGTLLNSGSTNTNAGGNASGIVAGNAQGAAAGNFGGGSGGAGGNVVLSNISGFTTGLPNAIQYGGGGGGGGNSVNNGAPGQGGAGGSPYGGNGGAGGNGGSCPDENGYPWAQANSGSSGNAATGVGGGGGGGGARSNNGNWCYNPQDGAGGAGRGGQVLVYIRN